MYGEETAPRYEYDYNAKGQVARVRDNLLNRTTQSEYDLANRPVRVKTAEAGQHVYTGQVAYDNVYGNLSEFTEKVGENRQEFGTKFGYDDENRPTSLTYSIGATTIGQSTTTIDKLNRTTFSAVKLGSKTFTSEYHFAAGGYGTGSVTNLVASITQPGCNCGYGYDDNGNIASATLNGKWTGYTYDELGQLIQVNDHSDTRSGENGTTWKYTYDLGGNILKKERFAYADTTTPLETVTYEYGDANWRDKLTAVNGNAIAYDAIGNPLHDGTWTYTWQNGRQLQKMQKSGVTAEFVYNADGLRVQKTVNGVVTGYTLHGKNVVHMTKGNDELHFFYDAQNRPAVVVYNGTAYAYVKSLQGDIVAILDENGNAVVSYGYDAWGAPLWCTGELAETLGKVQPFRYRGYVFDEETGLYYLRSRYYNPRCGRFINADTLVSTFQKSSKHNLFSYCGNSVISYMDPDGLLAISGLLVGVMLVACVTLLTGCTATDADIAGYNCYAYAVGRKEWMNPGGDSRAARYLSTQDGIKIHKEYFDVYKTADAVINDLGGAENVKIVEGIYADVPSGWHMIALRTGYIADADGYVKGEVDADGRIIFNGDYHFMRLDNGIWTHKPGGMPIQTLPAGMTPNSNGAWNERYDSEIIYMIVRDDW